uniref:Uncharacterized protein n=1 Tax=Anguilla anguilla TaxID=7936 RepID=A0A0E9UW34_ANGAN
MSPDISCISMSAADNHSLLLRAPRLSGDLKMQARSTDFGDWWGADSSISLLLRTNVPS